MVGDQRWICRGCGRTVTTRGEYPVHCDTHCPGSRNIKGAHRWIKRVTTPNNVHYICKYCRYTICTTEKTLNEQKHCARNPNYHKYHVFIKR
jgi:transposase-like protein